MPPSTFWALILFLPPSCLFSYQLFVSASLPFPSSPGQKGSLLSQEWRQAKEGGERGRVRPDIAP